MDIISTTRVYRKQSSLNRACGQFRRWKYKDVLTKKVGRKVYAVKVVRDHYPLADFIIRALNLEEARRKRWEKKVAAA